MRTVEVVVVGGGISGLAVAHRIASGGGEVLLLEQAGRVGGAIHSDSAEGFTFEEGPNTLHVTDPALLRHFDEIGLDGEVVRPSDAARRRYVVHRGRPHPLPSSPGSFLSTPLLSMGGRLRALSEPFRKRGTDPGESVDSFMRRRVGNEVADRLVDPFISGIHAGDPTSLEIASAFPTLWEAEQRSGSLLVGLPAAARAARRGAAGPGAGAPRTPKGLLSFRGGLGQWPARLAERIGPDRVLPGRSVERIGRVAGGWEVHTAEGERFQARSLVLATPAPASGHLLRELDPEASAALLGIPHATVSIVHLGYDRDQVAHPLDGFGMLCPAGERRKILGSLWLSSLFPRRTPEGQVLTTVFVGGMRAPERARLPDDALVRLVREEQESLLGARGPIRFTRIVRWDPAIPQYVQGHRSRIEAVSAAESRLPGLHLVGNWRGGISVPASWKAGDALGTRLLADRGRH